MVKYEKKDGAFGSYIVYEIDDVDSETAENETIELKMLKNNKIPGVLTYDIRYMDDKFCLYYDIKDMISMKDAINIKSVGYNELCRIYTAVIQIAKSCKKYLISFDSIMFKMELIYTKRKFREFAFCIFPDHDISYRKQLKDMTEELMRAVEHEDREGAEFIYELYEIVSTDSFFIGDIEEFVGEKKKIHDLKNSEICEDKISVEDKGRRIRSEQTKKELSGECRRERNNCNDKIYQSDIIGVEEKVCKVNKTGSYRKDYSDGKVRKAGKSHKYSKIFKNRKSYQDGEICMTGKDYQVGEVCRDRSKKFTLVRGNIKDVLVREFVPRAIDIKKSVSFGCGMEECVHIGRSVKNEVVFPQNYISRIHAVLEADENFLYVTDKGSLNGTFINGKKIAANVKTKCSVRDEITFADICFIVV